MSSYWTNACLQVARTYVHRARFWVAGAFFLLLALAPSRPDSGHVFMSATIAAVLACFVALHVRRQFGGPAAKVVPNFTLPHFVAAATISLGIWLVVPALQAWRTGLPAWGPIGAHAFAGLMLALVVCWRQAILLLVSVPMLLYMARSTYFLEADNGLQQFLVGQMPWVTVAVVLLTLAAHVTAAVLLLRTGDLNVSVSDDFSVELPPAESTAGRWNELWYALRDTAAGHYLADTGHGLWAVNRWRVPGAVSWTQFAAAALFGWALAGLTWLGAGQVEGALIGAEIVAFGILFLPLGAWHMRRGAMALELTRPVTRKQYFGEIALAMALDIAAWTAVASLFSVIVVLLVLGREPEPLRYVELQLGALWCTAAMLYAFGLATFRLRYWLPAMILMGIGWSWVTGITLAMVSRPAGLGGPSSLPAIWFTCSALLTSTLVTLLTLRRWVRADVT